MHASKALNVYKSVPTLFLSNDHTGYSELCTLFLDPDYRKDKMALFIKSAFLFIAAFRQYFSRKVIAEMRGYTDEQGRSPFGRVSAVISFPLSLRKQITSVAQGRKPLLLS